MKVASFGLILIALSGCSTRSDWKLKLDSFQLKTLQGEAIDPAAFKGKTVFINVWATWCKPCVQEMPTIAKAMEKLKGQDIVFLFASSEETADIAAFRDRRGFPFNYVQLENLEALSIEAIPATFIFNTSGALVFGEEGFRDWSDPENLELITKSQGL
jgi:thiol-disulfide isomerase/thioredoxin